MLKFSGLIKLNKKLSEATEALLSLDSELGAVNIDSGDPSSIEVAIQSIEESIDKRLGPYAENSIIAPVAEDLKKNVENQLLIGLKQHEFKYSLN